jgi:hypothetical protein
METTAAHYQAINQQSTTKQSYMLPRSMASSLQLHKGGQAQLQGDGGSTGSTGRLLELCKAPGSSGGFNTIGTAQLHSTPSTQL